MELIYAIIIVTLLSGVTRAYSPSSIEAGTRKRQIAFVVLTKDLALACGPAFARIEKFVVTTTGFSTPSSLHVVACTDVRHETSHGRVANVLVAAPITSDDYPPAAASLASGTLLLQ